MRLDYKLTEEEYIDFSFDNITKSKEVVRLYLLQKMVTIGLLILFIIAFKDYFQMSIKGWILIAIIALSIWTILEAFLIKYILKSFLRKELKKDNSPLKKNFIEIHDDYILTDEGMNYFKNISFIDDRENYILLIIRNDFTIFIPKRYLDDPLKFYDRVKNNYEKAKRLN